MPFVDLHFWILKTPLEMVKRYKIIEFSFAENFERKMSESDESTCNFSNLLESPESPDPFRISPPTIGFKAIFFMIGEFTSIQELNEKMDKLPREIGEIKFKRLISDYCYQCGFENCECEKDKLFQV